jgi:hypothetical protein
MFHRQTEDWVDSEVLAIVEVDVTRVRLRIVLAREAIRERLRELKVQGPARTATGNRALAAVPDKLTIRSDGKYRK